MCGIVFDTHFIVRPRRIPSLALADSALGFLHFHPADRVHPCLRIDRLIGIIVLDVNTEAVLFAFVANFSQKGLDSAIFEMQILKIHKVSKHLLTVNWRLIWTLLFSNAITTGTAG